jgi:hypothetical protein
MVLSVSSARTRLLMLTGVSARAKSLMLATQFGSLRPCDARKLYGSHTGLTLSWPVNDCGSRQFHVALFTVARAYSLMLANKVARACIVFPSSLLARAISITLADFLARTRSLMLTAQLARAISLTLTKPVARASALMRSSWLARAWYLMRPHRMARA